MLWRAVFCVPAVILLWGAASAVEGPPAARTGLTVVVDAANAAELLKHAPQPSGLVHGLVRDAAEADRLTGELLAAGKTGQITVGVWDGAILPFVSDTVNAIVVPDGPVSDEMRRALAPYGLVLDRSGKKLWEKPYPKDMDEWSHYLYAPNGNKVSKDLCVGPPRETHWIAGPEMLRHHDHLPSLSAMVSSGGRVFYIFDEGSSVSILFPPKWSLIARDAFNGVMLWKKEIPEWHPHLWPLKSMPATLPRRLVAIGGKVYATLGIKAPVTQFDAADGSEKQVFAGSERCEEIVVSGDTLLALCLTDKGPLDDMDTARGETGKDSRATGFPYLKNLMGSNKSPLWLHAQRRLIAYDLTSGREKWHSDGTFAPLSVATDGKRVCYHNGTSLEGLDFNTGKKLWTSPEVPIWKDFYSCYGASLVIYGDVVVFSGGENYDWQPPGTQKGADDTMTAVSAEDGRRLWSAAHPSSGYRSPEDLVIAQGLVWAPDTMKKSKSTLQGLDPSTGTVKRTIELDLDHGFHHRCYASRATEKYLLTSKVGINFVALDGSGIVNDHWVRGSCGYGIMPANGLIYATPDPCNCFPTSKVNGFAALAKADPERVAFRKQSAGAIDTEKGPAFGEAAAVGETAPGAWPTYRANAARSASTANRPPDSFEPSWRIQLGGRISAPVVADGKVFVSSVERNQVVAIDVESGQRTWTHASGGPVDSPPTVVGKRLYFGSADGTVTCLLADDGRLVWRRRLAPTGEKIVNDGRLESVWPVHGSVTFHEGLIYAIAGRNMLVDGGIHVCALDPATGAMKHSQQHTLTYNGSGMDATPSKPDILSASGPYLFMRSLAYDSECRIAKTNVRHVFAVNGYLNDTWFHRAFWTYSANWSGGCGGFGNTGNSNHSGRIMAADDTDLYSFGRDRYGWGSSFTYQLYKAPLEDDAPDAGADRKKGKKGDGTKSAGKNERTWSVDIPLLARSIIRAGDKLLVAGPTKLYDENEIIQQLPTPAVIEKITEQERQWYRKAGLLVIDPANGKVLKQVSFDFAPVWDGIAVAEQSLFISATDGTLYRCK